MWPMNCDFIAYEVCTNFRGVYCRGGDERELSPDEPLNLVIIHIMQHHLSDILRCVAFCNINYIIMKALSGFLMKLRQMTLKVYNV